MIAVESPLNLAVIAEESNNILALKSVESERSLVVIAVESPLNLVVIIVESFLNLLAIKIESFWIFDRTLIFLTTKESFKIDTPPTFRLPFNNKLESILAPLETNNESLNSSPEPTVNFPPTYKSFPIIKLESILE